MAVDISQSQYRRGLARLFGISRSCFRLGRLRLRLVCLLLRGLGIGGVFRLHRHQFIDGTRELLDLGLERLDLRVIRFRFCGATRT